MKHQNHAQHYVIEPVTHDKPTFDDIGAAVAFIAFVLVLCFI